ncbi:hypothetical protein M0R45_030950 [Rubus argutus]|uniref:Uncharacterized protein n=1 Tax=Rubus argutus TaxID=59490 RepID=A0AAW1WEL0_RUBAR
MLAGLGSRRRGRDMVAGQISDGKAFRHGCSVKVEAPRSCDMDWIAGKGRRCGAVASLMGTGTGSEDARGRAAGRHGFDGSMVTQQVWAWVLCRFRCGAVLLGSWKTCSGDGMAGQKLTLREWAVQFCGALRERKRNIFSCSKDGGEEIRCSWSDKADDRMKIDSCKWLVASNKRKAKGQAAGG